MDYYYSSPSYYDYYDYGYATSADSSVITALGAVLGAFLGIAIVISLVVAILQLAGMWKVFTKAGQKGWKCIIPIYNYKLTKITYFSSVVSSSGLVVSSSGLVVTLLPLLSKYQDLLGITSESLNS